MNLDLFGFQRARAERAAIMNVLRLIHLELVKLNVVAEQWNVLPLQEAGKVAPATVVTLSDESSRALIEVRQAETETRLKQKFAGV